MDKYVRSKETKSQLPSLHKTQSNLSRKPRKSSEPKFLFADKYNLPFSKHPNNIYAVKAHNFLNKSTYINAPQVIQNVSECIKLQVGEEFQKQRQFDDFNMSLSKGHMKQQISEKQNFFRSTHVQSMKEKQAIPIHKVRKQHCFERVEVLKLAKWIDTELKKYEKIQHLTMENVIEYKQHIINYGLGKIIDSVNKKCKEEGELLRIFWDNSFRIFDKVLATISDASFKKEKSYYHDSEETKQIYEAHFDRLNEEKQKVESELTHVYENMKRVIIWNKSLRRQRKHLKIANRVLEYRNSTYSAALEETIEMFMKSVPESSTLNYCKKIICKLAQEKRRKRHKNSTYKQQVDQDVLREAKQLVQSWLKRNGLEDAESEEDLEEQIYISKDDKLYLQNVEEEKKTDEVDIYDYFKMLDIGVQATETMKNVSCQYDQSLKTKTQSKSTATDTTFKRNIEIQVSFAAQQQNNLVSKAQKFEPQKRTGKKKRSNISKFSEKSEKIKQKQQKAILSKQRSSATDQQRKNMKIKGGLKKTKGSKRRLYSGESQSSIKISNRQSIEQLGEDGSRRQKRFTVISEKHSEEFNFDSDEELRNMNIDAYRVSISKMNGDMSKFNKEDFIGGSKGRQLSVEDFADLGFPESNSGNKLKKHWQALRQTQRSRNEEGGSRLSVNFIKTEESEMLSMKKLEKKYFNEIFHEQRHDQERLYRTVTRKRSFYKKTRVIFENASAVEENKVNRLYLYKTNPNRSNRLRGAIQSPTGLQDDKIDKISKLMAIQSNLTKSKTLASNQAAFKLISEGCKLTQNEQSQKPPKNKQFFNASLSSISKNIGVLVSDYIKQIRREKDGVLNDCQKTYYPLQVILMDRMNCRYGLKDISEKKIKDFIDKILTFAPLSEKVSLYSLLFGMQGEQVGADELLIYLKNLVYLEKKKPIGSSIHIVKESNFQDKAIADSQLIDQHLEVILQEFMDSEGVKIAIQEVGRYMQINPNHPSIQKISEICISCLLKRKEKFKKDYEGLYKLLLKSQNIFTNIYKVLSLYNNYLLGDKFLGANLSALPKILKEFMKRSDIIDEIYGKSISFDRFLTACMVTNFPSIEKLQKTFFYLIDLFNKNSNEPSNAIEKGQKSEKTKPCMRIFSSENCKFLEKLKKSWKIKSIEKIEEENWKWEVSKVVGERIQNNVRNCIGKLSIFNNEIENFFFSNQKSTE